MITKTNVKDLFEARGRAGGINAIHNMLGLCDEAGNPHVNENGQPIVKDAKVKPEEFSLRGIAEAIMGEGAVEQMGRAVKAASEGVSLMEAGGVDVTQFIDINTFNATVGGLIEFKILEGFKLPEFVMDRIFKSNPTKMNGQRMGRIGGVTDAALQRLPGMPTQRVGLTEAYIDTPETKEFALAIEINQEAIFFDLTGDILNQANGVGQMVGYRKEMRCIDVLLGITNPYSYMGTAYNTYQTATPWINDQVNGLTDWTDVRDSEQLFVKMTDPATSLRTLVMPKWIVCHTESYYDFVRVLSATQVRNGDGASNTNATYSANPLGKYELITSPLINQRHEESASSGLNLSAGNQRRWYHGADGAFTYMENWPLRVRQGAPNTTEMLDRGVVAYYKADERGIPAVLEPRKIVRNKVS